MRTIKLHIFGSAPAYAEVAHIDPCSSDGIALDLDGPATLGSREFNRCTVSAVTGALKHGLGIESDAVRIDSFDLPRVWDVYTSWMGREPTREMV